MAKQLQDHTEAPTVSVGSVEQLAAQLADIIAQRFDLVAQLG